MDKKSITPNFGIILAKGSLCQKGESDPARQESAPSILSGIWSSHISICSIIIIVAFRII
ncbi:MAG: hypothetical protein GY790_04340 [Bacteroidetes bacterium]|nr:hypothetical protein [Bacteroidota bacterium]